MKLKIKTLEDLILLLIIGQVVVFRFFNVYETMNKVILALIAVLLLLNVMRRRRSSINKNGETVSILIVVALLVLNGLLYGNNSTFKSNVLIILYPIMNMFYLTYYIKKYQDSFYQKMSDKHIFYHKYYRNVYTAERELLSGWRSHSREFNVSGFDKRSVWI